MTSRNNEDRLGAPPSGDMPVPPIQQDENAFSFVAPTEFVELPSKGKYYSEGHPLENQDTIEIRYMTAKDEDILSSKALIKKGVVIDRLLQNIIVDKRVKVDDLLVGDKNAIVVAARVTGYGEEYSTKITCPACLSSVQHTFFLSEADVVDPDLSTLEGVEKGDDGLFYIDAPRSNVRIGARLMTSVDEKKLLAAAERKKKNNLPEANLTDQLRIIVASVNGSTRPDHINSFIENMPASDSRHVRTTYAKIMPNVDLTQHFECSACEHEEEVVVPFTADFFWPK